MIPGLRVRGSLTVLIPLTSAWKSKRSDDLPGVLSQREVLPGKGTPLGIACKRQADRALLLPCGPLAWRFRWQRPPAAIRARMRFSSHRCPAPPTDPPAADLPGTALPVRYGQDWPAIHPLVQIAERPGAAHATWTDARASLTSSIACPTPSVTGAGPMVRVTAKVIARRCLWTILLCGGPSARSRRNRRPYALAPAWHAAEPTCPAAGQTCVPGRLLHPAPRRAVRNRCRPGRCR